MRHWVDELSIREENERAQQSGQLGRLVYKRVYVFIQECLEIYNNRHPKDAPISLPPRDDDPNLMMITISKDELSVGFEFMATRPSAILYTISDGHPEKIEREFMVDGVGRLNFIVPNRRCVPLEDVVQDVLQPILFPKLPPAWADYRPVY